MVKKTLIFGLAVLALNFQAFGAAWYSENFDKFNDGDIVGQDDWNIAMGQKTCQIQGKVKHGEMGKSVLVTEKTMVVRSFKGSNASTQYISLFARKDDGPGPLMIYIGGDAIKWGAAAKIDIKEGGIITANKGNADFPEVVKGKLGQWHHFRLVFDFKKKSYDFYVDGEKVVNAFGFRGEGGKGGVNPSLGWFFFGWDHPQVLTAYIDDIEMGDGEGENAGLPKALDQKDKLASYWANIKAGD
ncbi:MAG: hypothetical protein QF569_18810 [Candidatus Poribacteria bacterium]|jgi:hypothetical protein|nr:hypothetical protein [Candidatus Poribacteria bacterium]